MRPVRKHHRNRGVRDRGKYPTTGHCRNSQTRVVERLRKVVATETEAVRDLTSAEANLLQTQLEDQNEDRRLSGIARADVRRRLTVRSDITGHDQGGFVADAQRLFEGQIKVPPGYRATWLGMFENLSRAAQHFEWVVPASIAVIYVLLLATFASQRAALLLLLAIPFAFVGGAVALYLRGMNLNVSSGVGFAAVFGVSIMNGVLIVRTITDLRLAGTDLDQAILRGAARCLRPILIASLVAILGLVPASPATAEGEEWRGV